MDDVRARRVRYLPGITFLPERFETGIPPLNDSGRRANHPPRPDFRHLQIVPLREVLSSEGLQGDAGAGATGKARRHG